MRMEKAGYGKDKCLELNRTSSDRASKKVLDGESKKARFDTESREGVRVEVAPQSLRYIPATDFFSSSRALKPGDPSIDSQQVASKQNCQLRGGDI